MPMGNISPTLAFQRCLSNIALATSRYDKASWPKHPEKGLSLVQIPGCREVVNAAGIEAASYIPGQE